MRLAARIVWDDFERFGPGLVIANATAIRGCRQSPITSLTVVREAADGAVKMSVKGERADGSKIAGDRVVKYDGKEVPMTGSGMPWDTASMKQVNANTLTEERTKKGGTYHATVRHVVSNGGKIMTLTAKGTGSDGKPFTSINVFDKQ